LGTAQLGMDYGVANRTGAPGEEVARSLVSGAWKGGIRLFDTASHYGQSEAVLGRSLAALVGPEDLDQARVVSKVHPDVDPLAEGALERCLTGSLTLLGMPRLYGLLLHREEHLSRWDEIRPQMDALRDQGLLDRAGVSVYRVESALAALRCSGLDLLQVPSNILDRRFESAGIFERAAAAGVEVQVRSVFLQGLLLLDGEEIPAGLAQARPFVEAFRDFCRQSGLSARRVALGYALAAYPEAEILVGAETPDQVRENLTSAARLPEDLVHEARRRFPSIPEQVLNPSLWRY
jgi:aryl-alcohol dehydrogenase-like predicted oxidoreductase